MNPADKINLPKSAGPNGEFETNHHRLTEKFKKQNQETEALMAKRNIITIYEFEHFAPLFQPVPPGEESSTPGIPYPELSAEWSNRFNPYLPVTVMDGTKVVKAIPPNLSRIKSFNEAELDTRHIDALHNVMQRPDNPLRTDRERLTANMIALTPLLADLEAAEEQVRVFNDLVGGELDNDEESDDPEDFLDFK